VSGTSARFEPDEERSATYERLYTDVYKEIYPSLRPLFPKLSDALK
jgi:xylulokinase